MTAALYPQSFVFRALTTTGSLAPLSGGMLYFYKAGTLTPQAAYTDPTGATPVSNPLVLDGNGVGTFCLQSGLNYKIQLTDANGVVQDGYPVDNIAGDATALIGATRYVIDTGSVNAVSVTLSPPITAYYNGLRISIKASVTNTGATTINAGAGSVALVTNAGTALTAANIVAGSIFDAIYDGATSKFWICAPIIPNNYAQDVGAPNIYVIYTQAGTDYNGLRVSFKIAPGNSNTGPSTLNVGGGAKPILTNNGQALPTVGTNCKSALLVAGTIYEAIYDVATTSYWLLEPSGLNTYLYDTGVAPNVYAIAAMPAYSDGARIVFRPNYTNTGASTINAGAGVVSLVDYLYNPLGPGYIQATATYEAVYDSVLGGFKLLNIRPSTAPSTFVSFSTYAGTTSATYKMLGLMSGSSIQMHRFSYILVNLSFTSFASVFGDTVSTQLVYGTGTGPANGAAPVGTPAGPINVYGTTTNLIPCGGGFNVYLGPFAAGSQVWVDLQLKVVGGGGSTATLSNVTMSLLEIY
jgi:hypothetical protein